MYPYSHMYLKSPNKVSLAYGQYILLIKIFSYRSSLSPPRKVQKRSQRSEVLPNIEIVKYIATIH